MRDADTAATFLAGDVIAVNQGDTFLGRDEVYAFICDADAEFECTTEQIGARGVDDPHYVMACA